jgi:hypothetical protein
VTNLQSDSILLLRQTPQSYPEDEMQDEIGERFTASLEVTPQVRDAGRKEGRSVFAVNGRDFADAQDRLSNDGKALAEVRNLSELSCFEAKPLSKCFRLLLVAPAPEGSTTCSYLS